MHTAKCYNAYCTLLGGNSTLTNSQILNCALSNLQLHIVKSPFSHLHFYIASLTSLHYFTGCPKLSDCPQKNPLIAQFYFILIFLPKLCFLGFWGGWGPCISGLPSYLIAYILTNLHIHLLRLPIHLLTYLGVDLYPHLPTI